MSEKVKLKLKYVKLQQEGKPEEAFKVLQQIWNFKNKKPELKVLKEIKKKVSSKIEVLESNLGFKNLESLIKIKGIGKETIKDIKSLYSSIEDLIKEIQEDNRIPLRNDVVSKLKKHLK